MKEIEKKKAKSTKKTETKKTVEKVVTEKKQECNCCCKKSLFDSYMDVLDAYTKFSGRLSRREYWGFALFNFIFALLCLSADIFLKTRGILLLTYGLLTLVPSLAAVSRRLHDVNKSLWWGTVPLLIIPAFLQIADLYRVDLLTLWQNIGNLFLVVTYIALVLSFILCYFLMRKGCDGDNKYGVKPCC